MTTQHQVLGFDGAPGSDRERDQPGQVGQQPKDDAKQNDHAAMMPQPANSRVISSGRAESSFCGAQVKTKTWRPLYEHYRAKGLSSTAALVILARRIARSAWSIYTYKTEFNPGRLTNPLT